MHLCVCDVCVKRRAYWKEYRLKNKEKIAERDKIRNRKWRLANLEKVRARDREISKAYYASRVKPPKKVKIPTEPKKQMVRKQSEANLKKLAYVRQLAIELGYLKTEENNTHVL